MRSSHVCPSGLRQLRRARAGAPPVHARGPAWPSATRAPDGPAREAARSRTGPQEAKGYILSRNDNFAMFAEYIQAAMEKATYEIIDDPEPFYGEVPELQGVWATGKTLEECRRELQSVIEGWIALKLRLGHPIPPIGGQIINVSAEPVPIVE